MRLNVVDMGLTDYKSCFETQLECFEAVKTDYGLNYLILTEHLPIITIGRAGSRDNLKMNEVELEQATFDCINVSRGGDITAHMPGQLVVYPIINLSLVGRDIYAYIRNLEEVVLRLLASFEISCARAKGRPGVWCMGDKIASVGIAVRRWISFHGLSLNVDNDLGLFKRIVTCGLEDISVTTMHQQLGKTVDVSRVKDLLTDIFVDVFGFIDIERSSYED